jgi:hypothetical protein
MHAYIITPCQGRRHPQNSEALLQDSKDVLRILSDMLARGTIIDIQLYISLLLNITYGAHMATPYMATHRLLE